MNEGHKFISLGYLVLPSLNKAFTYLLTYLHSFAIGMDLKASLNYQYFFDQMI
jgi:hypothetical protein